MDDFLRGMGHALIILKLEQDRHGGRGSYILSKEAITKAMEVISDLVGEQEVTINREPLGNHYRALNIPTPVQIVPDQVGWTDAFSNITAGSITVPDTKTLINEYLNRTG